MIYEVPLAAVDADYWRDSRKRWGRRLYVNLLIAAFNAVNALYASDWMGWVCILAAAISLFYGVRVCRDGVRRADKFMRMAEWGQRHAADLRRVNVLNQQYLETQDAGTLQELQELMQTLAADYPRDEP